jgi:hypothetical protein
LTSGCTERTEPGQKNKNAKIEPKVALLLQLNVGLASWPLTKRRVTKGGFVSPASTRQVVMRQMSRDLIRDGLGPGKGRCTVPRMLNDFESRPHEGLGHETQHIEL